MYAARMLLKAEREDVSDVPMDPSRTPRHHPPYWREDKPCTSFRGILFRPTCEALLISPSECRKPCLFEEFRSSRLPPPGCRRRLCDLDQKIRDFAEGFASFASELSRCSRVTHSIGVASSRRDILLSTDAGMSFQKTITVLHATIPPEIILPLHASSCFAGRRLYASAICIAHTTGRENSSPYGPTLSIAPARRYLTAAVSGPYRNHWRQCMTPQR